MSNLKLREKPGLARTLLVAIEANVSSYKDVERFLDMLDEAIDQKIEEAFEAGEHAALMSVMERGL